MCVITGTEAWPGRAGDYEVTDEWGSVSSNGEKAGDMDVDTRCVDLEVCKKVFMGI